MLFLKLYNNFFQVLLNSAEWIAAIISGEKYVTVHTRVPSNGILPMLRIPNQQNLLPELYRTEFSVQKIPTCEQLLCSWIDMYEENVYLNFYENRL